MRLYYYLSITVSMTLLASCTSQEKNVEIKRLGIDINTAHAIPMDTNKIVSLETNNNSLLYDISGLYELDNKYFIWSRGMVKAFNKSGKYLYQISGKGQGANEYTDMSCVYTKDGNICIYDWNVKTVLSFNSQGQLQNRQRITVEPHAPSPVGIIPLGKDRYVCVNGYRGGDNVRTPSVSIWNSDFTAQDTLGGRLVESGFRLSDWLYASADSKRILYWEPLKDTLFTVAGQTVYPMCAIDFGDHAVPADVAKKDAYARSMYLGKKKNIKKSASMCRFYQIDGDYIYFIFSWAGRICLCRFSQKTFHPEIFEFKDERYKVLPFFKIIGNQLVMAVEDKEDMEKNCGLLVVDKKILDKNK